MREYTIFAQQDEEIQANLSLLADKQTRAEIYANALCTLGKKLALLINPKITSSEKIVLACTSEDLLELANKYLDPTNLHEVIVGGR